MLVHTQQHTGQTEHLDFLLHLMVFQQRILRFREISIRLHHMYSEFPHPMPYIGNYTLAFHKTGREPRLRKLRTCGTLQFHLQNHQQRHQVPLPYTVQRSMYTARSP